MAGRTSQISAGNRILVRHFADNCTGITILNYYITEIVIPASIGHMPGACIIERKDNETVQYRIYALPQQRRH